MTDIDSDQKIFTHRRDVIKFSLQMYSNLKVLLMNTFAISGLEIGLDAIRQMQTWVGWTIYTQQISQADLLDIISGLFRSPGIKDVFDAVPACVRKLGFTKDCGQRATFSGMNAGEREWEHTNVKGSDSVSLWHRCVDVSTRGMGDIHY